MWVFVVPLQVSFMQKIKTICLIGSKQRNPLWTDGRGESDNPPKFSSKIAGGQKRLRKPEVKVQPDYEPLVIITTPNDRTNVNPICSFSRSDTHPGKLITPDNRIKSSIKKK